MIFLGTHTDTIVTDNIECTLSFEDEVKDDTHGAFTTEMLKFATAGLSRDGFTLKGGIGSIRS